MRRNLYNLSKVQTGVYCLLMYFVIGLNASAQEVTDGLLLRYNFETSANDISGNGYNGVLNSEAYVTLEDEKYALSLGGDTEDYLSIDTTSGFHTALGSLSSYSVSSYVKLNNRNKWARIFDFGNGTSHSMFLTTSRDSDNGAIFFEVYTPDGNSNMRGTEPVDVNKWVHIVVSVDGAEGKLYVNGGLVASNDNMTISPASLGASNLVQSFIGKSQWPDPYLDGFISDFRVYNRALTETEVFVLGGMSLDLINARDALINSLGDLSAITSNLTLPASNGDVVINWSSSNENIISTDGTITQPEKYNASVILTAQLSHDGDTLKKEFLATVEAVNQSDILIVHWDYSDENLSFDDPNYVEVTDVSESGFVGKVMNDAYIETIGDTDQFNVLALGDGTGYFDMGSAIGEAIYSLGDYSMGTYFRIDDGYSELNSNGNFIWNFSNSDDAPTDQNGYIIGSLKAQSVSTTSSYWKVGNQSVGKGENAPKGEWHHMAYVQNGTTGTVYIDGVSVATGSITNIASLVLPQDSLSGTVFNWLGRSCYPDDVYLRKTLLYGFKLFNVAATSDDLDYVFGNESFESISATLTALNTAYDENPNAGYPTELDTEVDNLELSGIDALAGNISLPATGELDNTIDIVWSSSNPSIISSEGVVIRPEYIDGYATLTATLSKRGYKTRKEFNVKVVADDATRLSSDVIIHYNFDSDLVADSIVTDASEMAFSGKLVNGATVKAMGLEGVSTVYNVLNLENDSAYFDMGEACGELIYGLGRHYSISTYFFIEGDKSNFSSNGNFLYTFSNTNDIMKDRNGCLFGRATNGVYSLTSSYYASGAVSTAGSVDANTIGNWHHMVFVQNDTLGTVWVDGQIVSSIKFSNLPGEALPKEGLNGTMYNWLGRSPYVNDVNLGQALMYDFKVYSRSLSETEVVEMSDVTPDLDWAYLASIPQAVEDNVTEKVKVYSLQSGEVTVTGVHEDAIVEVYDITGRLVKTTNKHQFPLGTGLYLVKVSNYVAKVLVK